MRHASWQSAPWLAQRERRDGAARGSHRVSRLAHIQDAFQRFLIQRAPGIEAHVVGSERVSVATRLGIYGDGYRARLIEAMQSTFPVLATLLGEVDFANLAGQYVDTHVSSFSSIRYYGDELAAFLATDAEYSQVPLLAELAQWEWAMAGAFDAADVTPLDVNAFAQLPPAQWAELRFDWSPSTQVLPLEWNVANLWKAVTEDQERPEPAVTPEPVNWLIWRHELQIYFRSLPTDESAALAASRAGQNFGELCVLLCAHLEEDEASLRAASLLRGWVQSGLIVGVARPP
ncbi:MAG TPA: DNA-binding domain-containing protein [Steroidobacteraceae bacterium]|nr:DNA-binding domain-containing protein [Steroidobacteraceae bacterium]